MSSHHSPAEPGRWATDEDPVHRVARRLRGEVPRPVRERTQGRPWLDALLCAIILLGTALRLYRLGGSSLWVDEIVTANLVRMPRSMMLDIIRTYDNHPPLFYMISSLATRLGDSDLALRLPAAIAGILCTPVMFVLARRLYGDEVGLVAGLLLATSPFHLYYSQEARSYTLPILLQLVSMYCLYRAVLQGGVWAWVGYTLATLAGIYAHYFAFLWLAAQAAFVALWGVTAALRHRQSGRPARVRRVALPFVLSLIACALAYLPWYRTLFVHSELLLDIGRFRESGGMGTASAGSITTLYLKALDQIWRGFTQGQRALSAALLVAATAGVVTGILQRRWIATAYVGLSFLVPFAALGLASSEPYFGGKYGFPLLAPTLLFAGLGLTALGRAIVTGARRLSRRATGVAPRRVLVGGLIVAVAGFGILFSTAAYRLPKEDWRSAAAYLAAHKAPEDVIIGDGVFAGSGGDALRVEQGLGYYLHDPMAVIRAEPGLMARLPADASAHGTAWGAIWYQGDLGDRAPLAGSLEFADFYNMVVFHLKRPSGLVWNDSASILEAMLKLQPLADTHADLHLALAQLYAKMGDLSRAIQHADAAAALVPSDDQRRASALAGTKHILSIAKAGQAAKSGDIEGARAAYTEALTTGGDLSLRFEILMQWAIFERSHADPQAAISLLEQALALRPDDVEAHANYGAVLLDAGRLDQAIREFALVTAKAPDHYWAHYLAGIAYQQSARLPEAVAAWEKAAEVAVDDSTRSQAVVSAADAAMQLRDCELLRGISQRYASLLVSREKPIAQFLSSCP